MFVAPVYSQQTNLNPALRTFHAMIWLIHPFWHPASLWKFYSNYHLSDFAITPIIAVIMIIKNHHHHHCHHHHHHQFEVLNYIIILQALPSLLAAVREVPTESISKWRIHRIISRYIWAMVGQQEKFLVVEALKRLKENISIISTNVSFGARGGGGGGGFRVRPLISSLTGSPIFIENLKYLSFCYFFETSFPLK